MASQIHIISSMATKHVLADLAAQYEQAHPEVRIRVESVGGVEALKRVQSGEVFDIVALASDVIDQLIGEGRIAGPRVDLVRSAVHVAVKAGAPRPDLGSAQGLRQALLAAGSIGYSTGPSGVYLARLFEQWGIADQIKDRTVQAKPGVPVAALVAKGEVEIGFQQLSEMKNEPGIDIAGPLPDEIQNITIFSTGVAATSPQPEIARDLLAFMASPATAETKRANGMDQA